jgi:hypothetical protein
MPMRSRKQWRYLFASGKPFAERWARETPGGKQRRYRRLPETKAQDAEAARAQGKETPTAKPARGASAGADTGTPGKLTRSEAARLGALARWGKYKAKPKGKGRKPAKTAEQKEAERRQKAQENRTATLADLDVSEEAQTAMEALAMGNDGEGEGGDELIKMGLAERDKSGALRLTSAGRAAYNAASAGDKGRVKEALSRGRDTVIGAREKEAERAAEEERIAAEAEKPKGGGGGGGSAKPSEADKAKAKAEQRARTAAATAETVGLAKPALEALQAAAVGEGAVDDALVALGLQGADGLTTDQGRRALVALERGDVRQYRAALQDAQARMGREAAARERRTAAESAAREREQARAEQERERAARDAEREAARASRKRRMDRREALRTLGETNKAMDYAGILDELTALAAELQPEAVEVKAGRRNSAADQALIDGICEAAAGICEMAVALGARMPEMDDEDEGDSGTVKSIDLEARISRIRAAWYEAYPPPEPVMVEKYTPPSDAPPWLVTVLDDGVVVEQKGNMYRVPYAIRDGKIVFEDKGKWEPVQHGWVSLKMWDLPPAELPEDEAEVTLGIKALSDDLLAFDGDEVKALGEGWVGGYLVRFSDPVKSTGDLTRYKDMFLPPPETDYGSATKSDVYVHHRMLPGLGKKQLRNQADIGFDDAGVFIKHLLDLRDPYERALYQAAQQGKLGWSSGTAPHLVERKSLEDGRHIVTKWPLGLDASYTPTPAGGLEMTTAALKALAEAIDASPQANDPDPTETAPASAVKAAADGERERLVELELIEIATLEATWTT